MELSINSRLVRISGYLAAFSPGAAIYLSSHVHLLHNTPLAISLVLIGVVGRTFGRGPAIAAPCITAICFHYAVVVPAYGWSGRPQALYQTLIILVLGLTIAYLFQGQRDAERRLRSANQALQDKTSALVQAQQGSGSAAWKFDTATRKTSWYEGGSELFGRSLAEITAMGSPVALVLEEDRPGIATAAAHTEKTGQPYRVQFRVAWPNGEIRWLEACGMPTPSDPAIWLGVTTDITSRKAAEFALIRTEKLLAAGRLASSVSHEINNPLEAVTNLIYLARSKAVDAEQQAFLEKADQELSRVAYITNQSLRFHRQQSAPIELDIVEALREALLFYEPRIAAASITVALEMRHVPKVLCLASEMRQVFGNLIQNGLEAMPKGGHLRLRVRTCADPRNGVRSIRITIANTGPGMSAQTLKRIYEPFFTTKDETNTGLGLWVAAGIVDRHRGTIQVWSRNHPERGGTVFSVILPYLPHSLQDFEP